MSTALLSEDGSLARYPYSVEDLRADHPGTVFFLPLDAATMAHYRMVVVQSTTAPEVTIEQLLTEAAPALIDGVWTQQWVLATAPAELVAERRRALVPAVIDMAQARLELLATGLLGAVAPAIEALPEPQRSAARIEWEYRTQVHRASTLVATLGAALGLSDSQIDELFVAAARS